MKKENKATKRKLLKRLVQLNLKLTGEEGKIERHIIRGGKPRVLEMSEYADLCDKLGIRNKYAKA